MGEAREGQAFGCEVYGVGGNMQTGVLGRQVRPWLCLGQGDPLVLVTRFIARDNVCNVEVTSETSETDEGQIKFKGLKLRTM